MEARVRARLLHGGEGVYRGIKREKKLRGSKYDIYVDLKVGHSYNLPQGDMTIKRFLGFSAAIYIRAGVKGIKVSIRRYLAAEDPPLYHIQIIRIK
jgi:hypothetical protein